MIVLIGPRNVFSMLTKTSIVILGVAVLIGVVMVYTSNSKAEGQCLCCVTIVSL